MNKRTVVRQFLTLALSVSVQLHILNYLPTGNDRTHNEDIKDSKLKA